MAQPKGRAVSSTLVDGARALRARAVLTGELRGRYRLKGLSSDHEFTER
jgi:hypothetical protein